MLDPSRGPDAAPPQTEIDTAGLHARIRELEAQVRALEAEPSLRGREERLRLTVIAAQVGIWEHDLAADHFLMDPRAQALYGLDEVTPTAGFVARIHPGDRERLLGEITAALDPDRRAAVSTEYRVVHPDGTVRWLRVQGRVEFDGDGHAARPLRGLGTVQDVTAHREAEIALRQSDARYRTLFDSIDEGFCVVEMIFDARGQPADYRFVEANPAFVKHTGLPPDAVGRRAREMLPGLEEHWFQAYGRVALTGEPSRFESGSEAMGRWFDVFAFRVDEPEQRRVAILFTDVTEYRRAELEREALLRDAQAARAEAEAANRAKADFLASMSHELRTPLNAIGGYVELLELGIHGALAEAQRGALGRITANQRHLLTLINDILSFARLEAGSIEFDVHPLNAQEVLASVESLVAPQAEARGVAYTSEPCDPSLCFLGDAERVRQVLLNLVGNAIKFTGAGGWVVLSCAADDAWVELRVRDNGVGIPPEEQERIFDPFQQVGRRLSQPQEGVGLGLAISRDLARAMAGDLTVQSVPGEGSVFALRLPRDVGAAE
ncbi:PAS domain-containing sensor histidine kinase [Longimicrobium sp.]|uniref:PAS domain-containing sensor histidine kinase n=1 Tax=Longimicrobium sp. TaxID=2029185 RepID=UPI003B3AE03D